MPEVYKPLLIIFFLNIGQQFNGLNVLRVYIVQIFDYVFNEEGEPEDTLDRDNLYFSKFSLDVFILKLMWMVNLSFWRLRR